jgi:D-sedoheptulose 7-phosphate isomerase
MKQYMDNYFNKIKEIIDSLDRSSIEKVAKLIESAYYDEKHIFIVGNGGSAATASHMANDFSKGIKTGTDKHFKTMSLTDNMALFTAIGNDEGYEKVFVDQLKVFLGKDDLVIGISASGNSQNVINALEYAKSHDAKAVGIVGFDGGKIKEIADECIHVKTEHGLYGHVEDMHMLINHLISGYFIERFKKKE